MKEERQRWEAPPLTHGIYINCLRLPSFHFAAVSQGALTYTYDADGIRTSKSVPINRRGLKRTYSYVTQNGKLVRQSWLNITMDFIYDESGGPFALVYTNGPADPVVYYYVLNLQGDVVGLTDASGTFVTQYTYNAWGEILSSTGDMAGINPLRYRGYYYDFETGFYYLQSRYYDPANHRFINADSYASTGQGFAGTNMFAYCLNNPASHTDVFGLYPGDLFDTPEEAAEDFGNCYNGEAIINSAEYATFIYEIEVVKTHNIWFISWTTEETFYSYNEPIIGERKSMELPYQEYANGCKTVAVAHTHGAYDPQYYDEIFSGEDCVYAIDNNTIMFLITPAGKLKKFDPDDVVAGGKTICSNIVHDPASPNIAGRKFLFWTFPHDHCEKCAY